MNVDIPEDQWGAMVGAAVMEAISRENRDTLVKEAISYLLKPQKHSSYGPNRSPIQEAFDNALATKAREYVQEQLDAQIGEKIKAIVNEAIENAFKDDRRSQLVSNISDSIVRAFRVDGY